MERKRVLLIVISIFLSISLSIFAANFLVLKFWERRLFIKIIFFFISILIQSAIIYWLINKLTELLDKRKNEIKKTIWTIFSNKTYYVCART